MAKLAFWVHGNSVQAEREGYFISKWRLGWGTEFKTEGSEWFHFQVPTPSTRTSTLEKVFVLYETLLSAEVDLLHVYDGKKNIKAFDGFQYNGDHTDSPDMYNTWDIDAIHPIHIEWGLGLSVHVDFGKTTTYGVPGIVFASAGAEFSVP